ncbi:uncharacterized protein [Rutidosis leptorrhynchoides]|uniref:uncharacterized protein n=1 Tax=Rutidosis leptorrhynchoides TaxID=125765 RepID=UPI003A992D22
MRGGGDRFTIPAVEDVELVEILLTLPKLISKSEFLSQYSFEWGCKKKRSVLVSKQDSSPLNHRKIDESSPAAAPAEEADKSPVTPFCFLPSGSGSDDGDGNKSKQLLSIKKTLKRKATDDLTERCNKMQQENEVLATNIKAMKIRHQQLTSQNLELKAKRQEIIYPRNIVQDFQSWGKSIKLNVDQQYCYQQQSPMFAPPPQHWMIDPNLVAVSCSSNSGSRFGLFNHIDPRVKKIHGETYDFMALSQPLDQSRYLLMDNDLRVRTAAAAAARKRRMMRIKENKNNSLLGMKVSKGCR